LAVNESKRRMKTRLKTLTIAVGGLLVAWIALDCLAPRRPAKSPPADLAVSNLTNIISLPGPRHLILIDDLVNLQLSNAPGEVIWINRGMDYPLPTSPSQWLSPPAMPPGYYDLFEYRSLPVFDLTSPK
jgi:hypothetical protein